MFPYYDFEATNEDKYSEIGQSIVYTPHSHWSEQSEAEVEICWERKNKNE